MESPKRSEAKPSSEAQVFAEAPAVFDADFCQAVFGEQLTREVLDRQYLSVGVKDFDAAVAAIRAYPAWGVYAVENTAFKMKTAVAFGPTNGEEDTQILFLYENLE